jgi:hypothetical protein
LIILPEATVASVGAYTSDASGNVATPNGGTIKLFYCPENSRVEGRVVGGRVFESLCPAAPAFASITPPLSACAGEAILLQATLGVARPLPTLSWTHNGTVIAGQTSLALVLPGVGESSSGTYACLANGGEAAIATTLTVTRPPSFARNLPSKEILVDEGQDTTNLWVQVEGTPPFSFQWRLNGTAIQGGNQSVFPISDTRYASGGVYTVSVSNRCGEILSTPAVLQVFPRSFIAGTVWTDLNANGVWDTNLVSGRNPDVVFVLDGSGSTGTPFAGTSVGDVNLDGVTNDVLDAEIAGFIALNKSLIGQGLGTNARVGIVVFSTTATALDMNFRDQGIQSATSPSLDSNDNGIPDVEEILRSINRSAYGLGGSTDYRLALVKASEVLGSLRVAGRDQSCVFLSDGVPNPGDYKTEALSLRSQSVNLRAFGAGEGAALPPLQEIDPGARRFNTTDEILQAFGGLRGTDPETPVANAVVFVDFDRDGLLGSNDLRVVTGSDGGFVLGPIPAGDYAVGMVPIPGQESTHPKVAPSQNVTLLPNATLNGVGFGTRVPERFGSLRTGGGFFSFTYSGKAGVGYRIEATGDLKTWTTITNIAGTNYGPHVDPTGLDARSRIYRAVRQ